MTTREAACGCGQLRITCEGEPVRISVCHCLDCQRRTGSPFGFSTHYPRGQVTSIEGRASRFVRTADSGNYGHVPLLSGLRSERLLGAGRPPRARHGGGRRFRRSAISRSQALGLRIPQTCVGDRAGRNRAYRLRLFRTRKGPGRKAPDEAFSPASLHPSRACHFLEKP